MEFSFDTIYDQKALTAMARGLRKTVRKKHSRRSHIGGWIVILFILLLTIPLDEELVIVEGRTIITWGAGLAILVALLFEDKLNAWLARRRMMPGTDRATGVLQRRAIAPKRLRAKQSGNMRTFGRLRKIITTLFLSLTSAMPKYMTSAHCAEAVRKSFVILSAGGQGWKFSVFNA